MNEQLTDQVLIERVQNGDKQAFNLLVTKYQNKVCNLISRYVSNPGDVPDVAQEAFIKAYRAIPSFRGESAFYTWLYRIAVNTAKNHIVAQGRRPPATDVDAEEAEFVEWFRDTFNAHDEQLRMLPAADEQYDSALRYYRMPDHIYSEVEIENNYRANMRRDEQREVSDEEMEEFFVSIPLKFYNFSRYDFMIKVSITRWIFS